MVISVCFSLWNFHPTGVLSKKAAWAFAPQCILQSGKMGRLVAGWPVSIWISTQIFTDFLIDVGQIT